VNTIPQKENGILNSAQNFCKCGVIFEIFSLTDSQGNCLYDYDGDFHLT